MIRRRMDTAIRVLRAPFFTAVIVPALLGTVLAWEQGYFDGWLFFLSLVGAIATNAGLNLSNDYFDHLSGNDARNETLTPFSGGSRMIQQGVVSARQVLLISLGFYALAIVIGLYLAATRGWLLLVIGALGVFIAIFHNAPPIRLYHVAPGMGEFASGIGCGPLVVLGCYYVQTQTLSWEAFWASVPVALLVTAILYINEFPDREADAAVGRKTLPVVLGTERAVWGYVALIVGAYVVILVGTLIGIFPYATLAAFLTLPLAWKGVRGAIRHHSDSLALIPAQAATIQTHLTVGLLMCLGYLVTIVT